MSEPTTKTEDPLLAFILAFLTPLLTTDTAAAARTAAQQAIAAYQPNGLDQLVTIAQIVGFALASLDNLRLSMPADLSVSMKLKLRGNANALARSSQRATTTLHQQRRTAAAPAAPDQAQTPARPQTVPKAEPCADRQRDLSWANAMTDIAAEFSSELPHLSSGERKAHCSRIDALTKTARVLKRGTVPLKARLLGSTSMRG